MEQKKNNKKNYRHLLLKALLFLMLVAVADFITGSVLKYFYFRQSSGWEYRTKYSIEDTKAEVLIFGASRAQQQYNPLYIEDSLQQTCYNVGRDGTSFFYHYALLQSVLKRYTPKMIILDCEYGALKYSESSYDRLSSLLPFYDTHPEMRRIIELRGPYEKYKLLSKIYPYNSFIFKIAIGNLESNKKRHEDIKGYVELTHRLNEPKRTVDYTIPYPLDTIKVNMLLSFIDECKTKNIKLFLVCSPYYLNTIGNDQSFALTKKIADEKNIDFFDYSKDSLFLNNPMLFDDTVHLNSSGSKIFSAMIAHDLKQKTGSQ